jgi:hypothetical protein
VALGLIGFVFFGVERADYMVQLWVAGGILAELG